MFDKSNKAAAPAKKSSKPEAPQVSVTGAFLYSCAKAGVAVLTGIVNTYEAKVKSGAVDHWVKDGMANKRRPVNIKAVEGTAVVQVDLKIRANTSPVCAEDKSRCEEKGIPLGTHTKIEGHWIVNPNIAADPEKLDQIVKALKKLDFAKELFQWQEEIVDIVTDETLDSIFKLEDEQEVRSFLGALSVVSAKPTATDATTAFSELLKLPELGALISPSMDEMKETVITLAKEVGRKVAVRSKNVEVEA